MKKKRLECFIRLILPDKQPKTFVKKKQAKKSNLYVVIAPIIVITSSLDVITSG